jgi:hypothetical protein
MATSNKIFSLEGKGLKLDTAADLEPHIESLKSMSDVEEIRLLGNTLGVEACKALGEVLETKKTLQVSFLWHAESLLVTITWMKRSSVDIVCLGSQPGRHLYRASAQ